MIADKFRAEIEAILAKYPSDQKRSAVMPLLYLAQRDGGYVTKEEMAQIGELLDITDTEVASIIGFYTLYYDHPEGKSRIQVCNDLPCALRGADEFLDQLCENLGIQVGETTADGEVTVEAVMCLAACDKAPMFQVQTSEGLAYYEEQTVSSAIDVINSLQKQDTPT